MVHRQSPEAQYEQKQRTCGEPLMDVSPQPLQVLKCGCFTHILTMAAQQI